MYCLNAYFIVHINIFNAMAACKHANVNQRTIDNSNGDGIVGY